MDALILASGRGSPRWGDLLFPHQVLLGLLHRGSALAFDSLSVDCGEHTKVCVRDGRLLELGEGLTAIVQARAQVWPAIAKLSSRSAALRARLHQTDRLLDSTLDRGGGAWERVPGEQPVVHFAPTASGGSSRRST
jgi:hypothetical protein